MKMFILAFILLIAYQGCFSEPKDPVSYSWETISFNNGEKLNAVLTIMDTDGDGNYDYYTLIINDIDLLIEGDYKSLNLNLDYIKPDENNYSIKDSIFECENKEKLFIRFYDSTGTMLNDILYQNCNSGDTLFHESIITSFIDYQMYGVNRDELLAIPNPCNNVISIKGLTTLYSSNYSISILNNTGETVFEKQSYDLINDFINLSFLANGQYFLCIKADNYSNIFSFTVLR